MNRKIQTELAHYGLEILKRCVLNVLYQQPLDYTGKRRTLNQKTILQRLGISWRPYERNRLVPGILDILEADDYVEGFSSGHWRIKKKGIKAIEG